MIYETAGLQKVTDTMTCDDVADIRGSIYFSITNDHIWCITLSSSMIIFFTDDIYEAVKELAI